MTWRTGGLVMRKAPSPPRILRPWRNPLAGTWPRFSVQRRREPSFRPQRRPLLLFVPLPRDGRRGVEESLRSFRGLRLPRALAARGAKKPQAHLREHSRSQNPEEILVPAVKS